jgi:hypothetical protein
MSIHLKGVPARDTGRWHSHTSIRPLPGWIEARLPEAGTSRLLGSRRKRGSPWSGRRDSNPRPSPWQGDVLPLYYSRTDDGTAASWWARRDSNSHGQSPHDPKSCPSTSSDTRPHRDCRRCHYSKADPRCQDGEHTAAWANWREHPRRAARPLKPWPPPWNRAPQPHRTRALRPCERSTPRSPRSCHPPGSPGHRPVPGR